MAALGKSTVSDARRLGGGGPLRQPFGSGRRVRQVTSAQAAFANAPVISPEIVSVGTPTAASVGNTTTTSLSVTGTWGPGQVRAAGDLLVASVTFTGTSADVMAVTESSGIGWTLQEYVTSRGANNAGTAHVLVAHYTFTAAGGDVAPTFTCSGGAVMAGSVTLFDLQNANIGSPVDTWGSYSSGTSTITANNITATTTANIAGTGEFVIATAGQETAAVNAVWIDSEEYVQVTNGTGISSDCSVAVNTLLNPATGEPQTDTGQFSTSATAYAAMLIMAFKPAFNVNVASALATVTVAGVPGSVTTTSNVNVSGSPATVTVAGVPGTVTTTSNVNVSGSPAAVAVAGVPGTVTVTPNVYPVYVGGSGSGSAVTVTASTNPGDGVVVSANVNATTSAACTDSQGNTYLIVSNNTAQGTVMLSATYNGTPGTPTKALTAGVDTITFTSSNPGGTLLVVGVSGIAPQAPDATPNFLNGTSGTASGRPTGTLSTATDIIVSTVLGTWATNIAGVSSFGDSLVEVAEQATTGNGNTLAWKIASGTGSDTTTATMASSEIWIVHTVALLPTGAGSSVNVTGTPAGVTVAGVAGSVTVTSNVNVSGSPATVTVAGVAGSVTVTSNVNVSGSPATVTVAGIPGTVTASSPNVNVTGSPATVTVAGVTGSVTATSNVNVSGSPAVVTVAGVAGSVTATTNINISGGAATVTVAGVAGTVTATTNINVSGGAATVTVAGVAGSVTVTRNVNVSGSPATVTVAGVAGSTTTTQNVNVVGSPATVTVVGIPGTVTAISPNVNVSGSPATVTVAGMAGSVTATTNINISGGAATVTVAGVPGSITVTSSAVIPGTPASITVHGIAGTVHTTSVITAPDPALTGGTISFATQGGGVTITSASGAVVKIGSGGSVASKNLKGAGGSVTTG